MFRWPATKRYLASSDVFNSVVFFTTFTPRHLAVCGSGGGDAKLYAVNMTTGDAALNLTSGAVASARVQRRFTWRRPSERVFLPDLLLS